VVDQNENKGQSAVESKYADLTATGASAVRIAGGRRRGKVLAVAKPKKEKKRKNAQLVLRLNKELRDQFVTACQDLDTSAAREVRRFIKKFIKQYERGDFDE
jgi:hypothetical protein